MNAVLQSDPSVLALPLFLAVLLAEAWYSSRQQLGWYQWQDALVSLSMMVAAAAVEFVPRLLAVWLMYQLHAISPLKDVVGQQWWAWLLLFFFDDFSYYWFHRMNHEVRLFWAGHVNHHSSQNLNFATALRQGVGERVHKFLYWLWLPLLGFDPLMVLTMIGVSLFYQFWIHTRAVGRLHPWIEAVFNTPSHHRVHHASNIRYLDCNHGGVLIIWDRLFGTFSAEVDSDPVVYGLTTNIESNNPWTVLSHEYVSIWRDLKRAESWGERWKTLAMAPGWSFDGPDKRARTLRSALSE
tara:strand:+ start:765 stop:1652 length:888 start_codon:yes stop_codon:yes gene_type:complete